MGVVEGTAWLSMFEATFAIVQSKATTAAAEAAQIAAGLVMRRTRLRAFE